MAKLRRGDAAARRPGLPGAGEASRGQRFTELVAAEHALVTVRWAAVLFGVYLIVTYGGPAPPWVEPVGFGLVAGLIVTNTVAMLTLRRLRTVRGAVLLAFTTLVVDTLVVGGFVWMYTFDEGSVHFLLYFVLPAEAALKFRLAGALWMWTAIAGLYAARQAWAAATYDFQFNVSSIVFRLGFLLIVTVILGLFAEQLARRTKQLSETLEQLRREERWRTALINMLAHDFRAPVGTALATMQVINDQLDDLDDEHVRQLVATAMRQNRRGLALAEDILTLARARQDHLDVQREDVAVTPILRRAVDGISRDDSWLDIDAPDDLHATVDPARVEQIVANLLTNARKYGRPPIVLTARPLDRAGVELRVSDAGDGIAPEHQESLFTQFSGGPRRDSVGLGLWLVDVLATAHGGQATYATLEERPTFTVTLPGPSRDPAHASTG